MTRATRYYNSIKDERNAWRNQFDRCMSCHTDYSWPAFEVHEIERKAQAPNNWAHEVNYLFLCSACHREFGSASVWPHARQLALKWDRDTDMRKKYTLAEFVAAWRTIGKRPDSYVTAGEVQEYLGEIQC